MRFARIAALWAVVKGLFARKPKRPRHAYQAATPKTDATRGPSLRGTGKASRALRKQRRRDIARSFTRFYARKPRGSASVGPLGLAWSKGMQQWLDGWAKARANSSTVDLRRKAAKRAVRS